MWLCSWGGASSVPLCPIALSKSAARLDLRAITKSYPGCLANDRIDLRVMPGEVHALLGENGAGKSTLVQIIYGVVKADSGELRWEGEAVQVHNPAFARRLGVGMVFQHFSLFETLTVAENIALGVEDSADAGKLAARIIEVSERYGLPLDPRRLVHTLSVGERQRVEIVRCLLQSPRLLIMDEPTSVLTPQEVQKLFETLRRLSAEGCSILYISHKLDEIQALCQKATVLRAGRVTAACDPRRETADSLARMMIGSDLPEYRRPPETADPTPCLKLDGLSLASDEPFGTDLQGIRLRVGGGEIVGIAGVAGNGQRELLAALSGERRADRAEHVVIAGRPVGRLGAAARRALGLAFVPEERRGRGAVPDLSLVDNGLLTGYGQGLVRHGLVRFGRVRRFAERIREQFDVRCPGVDAIAGSLSGGNLQKFIVGREILQQPRLLVAGHPTWGVDVGAADAIHRALIALRNAGSAVLVVSEDLDEMFKICDRIAVISEGRLSPSRAVGDTTTEEVGRWMGGLFDDPQEHANVA